MVIEILSILTKTNLSFPTIQHHGKATKCKCSDEDQVPSLFKYIIILTSIKLINQFDSVFQDIKRTKCNLNQNKDLHPK